MSDANGSSTAVADGERLAGSGSAPGYAPGRTLPLAVEIVRQFKRRRTLACSACCSRCRGSW